MEWMKRIRMKALALVLALALVAIAMLSLTTWPAWPVVGMAVATAAVMVNSMASKLRLEHPMCVHCNQDLTGETPGVYGVACPNCGNIEATLAHDTDEAPLIAMSSGVELDDSNDDNAEAS